MRNRGTGLLMLAALALAACCCTGTAKKDAAVEVRRYTIEEFMGSTRVSGASFSSDGKKILVSSNQSGIFNAYSIPTDGGPPIQLTRSTDDAVSAQSYFPHDERFLYLQDEGGNELDHLYVQAAGGAPSDLTPGEKLKAAFAGWALDDQSFFVLTNERDERFFDVYEYATDGYERKQLFKDEEGLGFAAVSPDRRYLAFSKEHTTSDSDVFLHDRTTGKTRNLTAHPGEMKNQPQDFSIDGKSLYYLTDDGSEFAYALRYDLATGEKQVLEKPSWDVAYVELSKRGKYLVAGINDDARTEIKLYEAATMRPVLLPDLPRGDVNAVVISPDETQMAFYVNGNRTPNDLFVVSLAAAGAPRQLTHNLDPRVDAAHLADGEVVRFRSYDGVEIPGILYKPHGAAAESKVPALVWVHGGPGGQSRIGYVALLQYLVNHGYAVYAINNRGSSGYGKSFYKMDDRRHGEADLGDCVASKKMLAETGWIDPDRIGILGGSYGGYMTLAALTLAPEEFRVGVDLFGISNWVRTLENVPPWWESFRQALYQVLGDPKVDAERLHRISPLFNAERVTRPLMVLQGKNDPRVLKQESDDIVAALRARKIPVEYIIFDDEGHGFENKANEIRGYEAILKFLEIHLAGDKRASG